MKFWNTLYRFKAHHVLLWIAYFAFWMVYYGPYYPSKLGLFKVTCLFFFNAGSFYIIGYYLFPRYLYKRKYLLFALWSIVIVLLFSSGLAISVYQIFSRVMPELVSNRVALFQLSLLSIITMSGPLSTIKLVIDKVKLDKITCQLDQQWLESELQYLKAQVNPHFLFNAINSVYFLIKKNPDVAAETLIKLSDLLRFQLYDCSGEHIPIEKEMEYLKNFIDLEKIRKGERIKVEVTKEVGLSGFHIAPFLLITFLENTFKHVSTYSDKENEISIQFKREGDKFIASFVNTADNLKQSEVGGIGLKNVTRRLELLYPTKHKLDVKEEPGVFSVHLSITIL
jgi:two-component system, LytTR family, sensor kinase